MRKKCIIKVVGRRIMAMGEGLRRGFIKGL